MEILGFSLFLFLEEGQALIQSPYPTVLTLITSATAAPLSPCS